MSDDNIDNVLLQTMIEDEQRDARKGFPPPLQFARISDADLSYFVTVMAQFQEAQQALNEAQQYEQMAQAKRAEAQAKLGAHNSYVMHLFTKYHLTAGQDRIHPDGRIERGQAQANPDSGNLVPRPHTDSSE